MSAAADLYERALMRFTRSRAVGTLASLAVLGLLAPALPASPAAAAGPGQVDITLLNINDFHGRIDANTVKFAGTVEQLRAAAGESNTLFLSAGDNIGASLFASATLQDQPTIDVLNALELDASAVGNHEFDTGWPDLRDRVINGGTNAQWTYLAANVYDSMGDPILPEYALYTVAGETVAVIGVVTEETPSLVSPSGVAGLTFGDPVDAVNRVAEQLSDDDLSNGEADIIVAEFHDGAGAGIPEGSTIEQEVAAGGEFARIVNETSPLVDAMFTGHTHKTYAWDAPVPGQPGVTRPIVQTGSYGERIGKIVLTVDQTTKAVVAYTKENVNRTTAADATLVSTYPRVAAVKTVVDAALANATIVGGVQVGTVTTDITTAFNNGTYVGGVYTAERINANRDNRAMESTLGNLVSDSMLNILSDPLRGGAEIAVMNPGGLRAELYYPGATVADDGKITYAEANAVLPFANSLFTITLTGAQFKVLLEQQWQRTPGGAIPSRPYLQLGLSNNVSYTFDPSLPEGSRITSITVNGAPIDPTAEYRIGSNSFLLEGGDNFHVFKQGTNRFDSGFIDRDAWISYLTANSPLSPDFSRQSVQVAPHPSALALGGTLTTTVSGLNLTSLGSPENTSLSVSLGGVALGTVPVTNGTAAITLDIPTSVPTGTQTLTMVAAPSNTTVTFDVDVAAETTTTLITNRVAQRFGGPQTARLTAVVRANNGVVPTGSVEFLQDGDVVATVALSPTGRASYLLPASLAADTYLFTARFVGNGVANPSTSAPLTITVNKASSITLLRSPKLVIRRGQPAPTVTAVVLLNSGATPTGSVVFTVDGTPIGTVPVVNGKASIQLPSNLTPGSHVVRAEYLGDESINGSTSLPMPILVLRR